MFRANRAVASYAIVALIACALSSQGCCPRHAKAATAKAVAKQRWAGGEVHDESDGMAKAGTVGTTAQAGMEQQSGPARTGEDYRPVVPDAPEVKTKTEEVIATKGPSPWGAPDAES